MTMLILMSIIRGMDGSVMDGPKVAHHGPR